VLGGTRLSGGRGSLLRTGIGVLFLGFLSNGMSLLGLQDFDQQMITGGFIFLAAAANGLPHWLPRRPPAWLSGRLGRDRLAPAGRIRHTDRRVPKDTIDETHRSR
jgi:hypothetical protein